MWCVCVRERERERERESNKGCLYTLPKAVDYIIILLQCSTDHEHNSELSEVHTRDLPRLYGFPAYIIACI